MIMDLIHYGNDHYIPSKFKPIKNCIYNKPQGGLWASPVITEFGWKEWNERENFTDTSKWFQFKYEGNIFVIDSYMHLEHLRQYTFYLYDRAYSINYEKMLLDEIDAVFLTANGERETRFTHPFNLMGWDCESICILNPKGIILAESL